MKLVLWIEFIFVAFVAIHLVGNQFGDKDSNYPAYLKGYEIIVKGFITALETLGAFGGAMIV